MYSVDHRPTRGRLTKKSEDVGWGGSSLDFQIKFVLTNTNFLVLVYGVNHGGIKMERHRGVNLQFTPRWWGSVVYITSRRRTVTARFATGGI